MNQFLTGDVWRQVNQIVHGRTKKTACIAYVTTDTLELSKGDVLICDASTHAIKYGETSARILYKYFSRGVKIYSNKNLHAKTLLSENILVIGSANLSTSSSIALTEASLVTNNAEARSAAKAFCYNLIEESAELTAQSIDRLLQIEVVKRPGKRTGSSKVRRKKFGKRYWFISTNPLSERQYEKIRKHVEQVSEEISGSEGIDLDDVGLLRWETGAAFSKAVKEGDQIIIRSQNKGRTRRFVYPPSTILKKERKDGFTLLYHDNTSVDAGKISWTKFQDVIRNLELEKTSFSRLRTMSKGDVEILRSRCDW